MNDPTTHHPTHPDPLLIVDPMSDDDPESPDGVDAMTRTVKALERMPFAAGGIIPPGRPLYATPSGGCDYIVPTPASRVRALSLLAELAAAGVKAGTALAGIAEQTRRSLAGLLGVDPDRLQPGGVLARDVETGEWRIGVLSAAGRPIVLRRLPRPLGGRAAVDLTRYLQGDVGRAWFVPAGEDPRMAVATRPHDFAAGWITDDGLTYAGGPAPAGSDLTRTLDLTYSYDPASGTGPTREQLDALLASMPAGQPMPARDPVDGMVRYAPPEPEPDFNPAQWRQRVAEAFHGRERNRARGQ